MKIGLSLSLCVRDILLGRVREEEVECLIVGTMFLSDEQFEHVLDGYAPMYWRLGLQQPILERDERFMLQGKAIARRLRDAGKLHQPRADGLNEPSIVDGHWIDTQNVALIEQYVLEPRRDPRRINAEFMGQYHAP
jgi:hypothetical protein